MEIEDQKGHLASLGSLGNLEFQGCQVGLENLGKLAGLERRVIGVRREIEGSRAEMAYLAQQDHQAPG